MLAITKVREMSRLVLLFGSYSNRKLESMCDYSHQRIGEQRQKLTALNVTWPDIKSSSDNELKSLFYPKLIHRMTKKIEPDYDVIYQEVIKKGKHKKTLAVLCFQYREKYGIKAYKESRFYELVRNNLKTRNVFMKQLFLPGEVLFIDYAGTRIKYRVRGKEKYLYVFVTCLGFSKKLFAFATKDTTSKSWILGLTKALENYGGVTEVIQFDNAKAMVTKAALIAILNDNAKSFARHYGCICDTSRVGTPTDNPNAESAVKFISQRVLEPMNKDFSFFSQVEANQHLEQEVEKLNDAHFQKQPYSRNTLFDSKEKAYINGLPSIPYQSFILQKEIKVPSTYLIPYKGHEYSVPYTLAHKEIVIRITEDKFLAYDTIKLVAEHELSFETSGFTRIAAHMKPSHLAEERKSKKTFISWAHGISEDVEVYIEKQYNLTRNPQSRVVGKRCIALQKLCDKCGEEVFSKACCYANEHEWFEPKDVELIIRAKVFKDKDEPRQLEHQNIRGKTYFEEQSHE